MLGDSFLPGVFFCFLGRFFAGRAFVWWEVFFVWREGFLLGVFCWVRLFAGSCLLLVAFLLFAGSVFCLVICFGWDLFFAGSVCCWDCFFVSGTVFCWER